MKTTTTKNLNCQYPLLLASINIKNMTKFLHDSGNSYVFSFVGSVKLK